LRLGICDDGQYTEHRYISQASRGDARANIAAQVKTGTNVLTMDAIGSVLANRVPTNLIVCNPSFPCASPPTGLALMAGAGFSVDRIRMVAEIDRGALADFGFYSIRSRTSRVSFLGGFTFGSPRRLTVTPLGGLGVATNRYTLLIPGFGTTPDADDDSRIVWSFGADASAPIARNLAVVVPIRFSQGIDFSGGGRMGLDVRAGAGLSFTYRRQAR
jgi:hypothetical protein